MPKETKPKATKKEQHAQRVLGRDKPKQRAAKGKEKACEDEAVEISNPENEKELEEYLRIREEEFQKDLKAAARKPARTKSGKSTRPSAKLLEAQKKFKKGTLVYVRSAGTGRYIQGKVMSTYEQPMSKFEPLVWVKWVGHGEDKGYHDSQPSTDFARHVQLAEDYLAHREHEDSEVADPEKQASGSGSKKTRARAEPQASGSGSTVRSASPEPQGSGSGSSSKKRASVRKRKASASASK